MQKQVTEKKGIRLQDVLLIAMIGLIFSIVYMLVLNLGMALQVALTPLGLGVLAFEIVYGIWFMAATVAASIIRKPLVAFSAEFLAAVLELLLGNPGGMMVVITGLIQGVGGELGYLLLGYKKWRLGAAILSAITSALVTMLQTLYIGGYAGLSPGMILAMLGVRIASAVFFTGVVGYGLTQGLARTGVLRSYPIGQELAADKDVELDDESL